MWTKSRNKGGTGTVSYTHLAASGEHAAGTAKKRTVGDRIRDAIDDILD